jgi:chaperonin GroES
MANSQKDDYFGIEGDVEDTEDGGAIISFDNEEPLGNREFYANLAEDMEETELAIIGSELSDLIEKDKKARERRDEQYEEGVRRTGLGEDAPGGAEFMGASKVVHPMLTEACVDFSARVMKEIFPADGPVKTCIIGEPTIKDIERADRIAEYLNYQCRVQMSEMRAELEQMTTQLPLGGGQYVKLSWFERKKRPTIVFVPIDDVYLPFAATNFYNAERKTHCQYITRIEFGMRVESGMYRDIENIIDPMPPETSKTEMATDKIEGREPSSYNEDGLRTIYECFCLYKIDKKTGVAPYIISIDATTKRVLSIYRNWDEEDEKKEELDWIVEFPFVPWRGAYPIGLTHMIGGLSAAATGSLRALLDSALINNFPGLLKLKGGTGGQTLRPSPTEVVEIEGSIQDDDVRKLVMPMPYNPPSPVLFELLGYLVEQGKGVIRTTMEETADSNQNTPVGTTLARLEQGMMVFSAIHARLHDSMGRLLKVLYRINKFYLEEEEIYDDTGKLLAYRRDFQGPMTIVPVSDPNIFSESQRFAQIQLIAQRAQMLPQLYDLRKVEELILERMKLPDAESLLLPKQEASETNAVNENFMTLLQRPIVAYPDQDHLAHIQAHIDFIRHPLLGQNAPIALKCLPALLDHLQEHLCLWYVSQVIDVANEAAESDINELQKKSTTDERKAFDKMLALASKNIMVDMEKATPAEIAEIPQIVQQCQQLLQQMQPPPQADPAVMAQIQAEQQIKQMEFAHQEKIEQMQAQLKQAEIQAKTQSDMAKSQMQVQTDQAKIAEDARQSDQVMVIEQMRQAEETKRMIMDLQTKMAMLEKELQAKFQTESQKMQMQGHLEGQKLDAQMQLEGQKQASAHALEDKKMSHASSLEDKKAQTGMQMEGLKQQSTHALEDKRMQHTSQLEDKKAQSGMQMEGMKQTHAKDLEGFKQSHASQMEQDKAIGGMVQAQLTHDHSMEAERERMAHETTQQRKSDTMDLYKHDTTLAHQTNESEADREHTSKLEKEKAKFSEKLEGQKSEHDMKKTKMVEQNKTKVADKQLKLKEKEGKEQLKIKQDESKHGMSLKEEEHGMKLKFKEAEAKLGLKSKEEKAKLDNQYQKEEHKGKLGLLKTKTKLTEAQLKQKAKASSEKTQKKDKK